MTFRINRRGLNPVAFFFLFIYLFFEGIKTELWRFKVKQSMLFVKRKYNGIENGESNTQFERDKPCVSARTTIANLK